MTDPQPISDAERLLLSPGTAVPLDDDGAAGYYLAASLDTDGDTDLWIVDRELMRRGPSDDTGDRWPTHEDEGELPDEFKARIAAVPLLCGRPTRKGRPCRLVVDAPGAPCQLHQTSTADQETNR